MPYFYVIFAFGYNSEITVFEGVLHEKTLGDDLADLWYWVGIGNVKDFTVDYES